MKRLESAVGTALALEPEWVPALAVSQLKLSETPPLVCWADLLARLTAWWVLLFANACKPLVTKVLWIILWV